MPPFDFVTNYSNVMKTMLYTLFFNIYTPIGTLITLVCFVGQYHSYKYALVKFTGTTVSVNDQLNDGMNLLLEFCILLFAASSMVA